MRRWMLVTAAVLVLIAFATLVIWVAFMPGKSHRGPLAPLSEREAELRDRLRRQVQVLAGDIGGRTLGRIEGLDAAAAYIREELASFGLNPKDQIFQVRAASVSNIEAELSGDPGRIVVIGAHYDTAGGLPGANDNGTGVAAALELAKLFARERPEQTLRFVFFVNEEPPYFQTAHMGSLVYARRCKERGERVTAMLSLETIGYYSDEPGSQSYPSGLSLGFPDTANFIGFVSNLQSRSLLTRVLRTFRETTAFPSEGAAAPSIIPGVGWSDHWSFWQQGYPAVMVTDTAPYRYPYYHTAEDTPDKIDYDRFARVTAGLVAVTADLAGITLAR
jgi:hypothetical protein